MPMIKRNILAIMLWCSCASAWCVEIQDDTVLMGLDAGVGSPMGGAANAVGMARSVGGQFLYHPIGEWGMGAQVQRIDFKSKGTSKADFSSIMATARPNISGIFEDYLPYMIFGMGYAESRADIPGGIDRGSGFAFCLGGGIDRPVNRNLSIALEFKLQRLGAPLAKLGLSGVTLMQPLLRLNLWLGPDADPFKSKAKPNTR